MSSHNHHLPTLRQLFKATAIAAVAASVILVTTVLPSEFGIDPTGIGKAIGLTPLSAGTAEAAKMPEPAAAPTPATQASTRPVAKSQVQYRSDEMSLTLQPDQGAEIKSTMRAGEQFVFTWAVEGGAVNVDMHGEKPNAGEEFTSYWKAKQVTSDQGSFIAPFDGTHGWFWRNRGEQPVTVKVNVTGFYEKLARVK